MPAPASQIKLTQRVQSVLFFFVLSAFLAYYSLQGIRLQAAGVVFWDSRVYVRGILAFMSGADPYQHVSQLNFVYPPLFLHIGRWLVRVLSLRVLEVIYLVAVELAVFTIPFVIVRYYISASWLSLRWAILLFFCFPLFSELLFCGNLSSLFYAVILIAGVPGVRSNRWLPFYVTLACCAFIKPPLLTFLLLPFFLGRRQLLSCCITAAAVLIEALTDRLFWPEQYAAFLSSVHYQLIVLNDSGFGVFRYVQHFHLGTHLPWLGGDNAGHVIHLTLVAALLVPFWLKQRRGELIPREIWISVVLVLAVLSSPRMVEYDADVAFIPAMYIFMEVARAQLRNTQKLALLSVVAVGLIALCLRSAPAGIFAVLLVSVFLVLSVAYRSVPEEPVLGAANRLKA